MEIEEGANLKVKALKDLQHFTQPPPRYTEATLVKILEELGIGRPSTYASIISTIQDREYVIKDERRLKPTELGTLVTGLLIKSFPKILDSDFTAGLEDELDQIEEGTLKWTKVMEEFYVPFKEDLERAKTEMKSVKGDVVETELKCDKCGSLMVIKWGRRGKFLACSGYPECKSTSDFKETADGKIEAVDNTETVDALCPKCEGPMAVKSGRFGRFLACTAYPDCKGTRPYSLGLPCPEEDCSGELTERRTKKGRVFYGCSKYPDCKYATWTLPKKD